MKNLKRGKTKLKNIIIELLIFAAVMLLLKFRCLTDGTMVTWTELLKYIPIIVIIMLVVGFRNKFLFFNKENNEKEDEM